MINPYLFAGLLAFVLTLTSYYFEYVVGLEPCPLCLIQRYLMVLLIPLFIWRWYVSGRLGAIVSSSVLVVVSGLGVAAAARHMWLEWQPDEAIVSCLPDLEYMITHFPLTETIALILDGSGCSQVDWHWLGLSMPTWVLLWFIGFMVLAVVGLFHHRKVDVTNNPK